MARGANPTRDKRQTRAARGATPASRQADATQTRPLPKRQETKGSRGPERMRGFAAQRPAGGRGPYLALDFRGWAFYCLVNELLPAAREVGGPPRAALVRALTDDDGGGVFGGLRGVFADAAI